MNRAERRRQEKLAKKAARKSKSGKGSAPTPGRPTPDIQQALNLAMQHHNAGRLPEAEKIYQQILQTDPDQPAALHQLGLVAHQSGRIEAAVDLITKALVIEPDFAHAQHNLGLVYQGMGRLDEAVAGYRKTLTIDPDFVEAHYNLGVALKELGKLVEAAASMEKALALRPQFVEAHINLGVMYQALGRLEDAVSSMERALAIRPEFVEVHNNLGLAYRELGKLDKAAASLEKALALRPDYIEAHINLGATFQDAGKLEEAVSSYHQALTINPDLVDAHYNLGITLQELGKLKEAAASYNRALEINPGHTEAHNNLGDVLRKLGMMDEAMAALEKALAIRPDYVEAHINLGLAFKELGKLDEAIAIYNKALALNPNYAKAHNNLALVQIDLGEMDQAAASCRKAIACDPDFAGAHNNLGNVLQEIGDWDKAIACYRKAIDIDSDFTQAHSNLIFIQDMMEDIDQAEQQRERQRWNDKFIVPMAKHIGPHANGTDPDRRLRIGYVSADFYEHSACQAFGPLILDHDRDNFDVVCYDAGIADDAVNKALRGAATQWRNIRWMDDVTLAETIRDDAIDILVDLSGHTRGNRLLAFGCKPAPVQVSGIGHLAPGVSTIDYRLTTEQMTPPDEETLYPESPIYLATSIGFIPPPGAPPVAEPPCMECGTITFGFLGRFSKISDVCIALWSEVLKSTAGSRMLIKCIQLDDPAIQQSLKDKFAALGIPGDRLIFLGRTSQSEHMEAHNRIDIFLDSFPHVGGITALESLWMGVPVVGMMRPEKAAGRTAKVIAGPLGLGEWVAHSESEYLEIAVSWANRGRDLAEIRHGLRHRISEIYCRFPKDIEKSYRLIWQRWCRNESPKPLFL